MTLFQGLSAFPVTPADEHGVVDLDGVATLVGRLAVSDVTSIGLLGSTGIYAYLTRTERRRAIRAAVTAAAGRKPLIVGVGALRTDNAEDLALDAEAEGADALLMAPMSYTPLTEDEVYAHYAAVSAATALPLCVYNNPATTHFSFSTGLIARLAGLPNIAAIKMPLPAPGGVAGDLARLRASTAGRLSIGYSGDWGMAEAGLAKADGFHSVLAGLLPREVGALWKAATTGDQDETLRLDRQMEPLWALFREVGSLRVVYAALALLGLSQAQPPRPLLPLPDDLLGRVAEALGAATVETSRTPETQA